MAKKTVPAIAKIIVVNHPNPGRLSDAVNLVSVNLATCDWREHSDAAVIAIPCDSPEVTASALAKIQTINPYAQKLISARGWIGEGIKKIFAADAKFVHLTNFESSQFSSDLQNASKRYELQIKKLRDKERSKKRSDSIKLQVESLHRALLAVHSAQSIVDIELMLFSALSSSMELDWVRVFLFANDQIDAQLDRLTNNTLFAANLSLGSRQLGKIVFARTNAKPFSKSEEESLGQISESVALAIDRLAKLDQAETLKMQWDSTFDAISEPLCLTDHEFHIIRTNQAFIKTTKQNRSDILGRNCFEVFSGRIAEYRPTPPPVDIFLIEIKLKDSSEPSTFEVSTQKIFTGNQSPPINLVMFRDVTEQKKIEKQILETAKMAELGTIGSSIAHDINNPLGGMINFLQLIKMDIDESNPIYKDVIEMERAGQRCKEIVENLLRFSRRQDLGERTIIDLIEVIRQALKISELQTRSLGIQVEFKSQKKSAKIMGHFNLLSQAINHILQNAIDAVSDKLAVSPGFGATIKIDLIERDQGYELNIVDNGVGISPEHQSKILNPLFTTKPQSKKQGLGLTMAYQILHEHRGSLEIFSQPNVGTTVKISFINV